MGDSVILSCLFFTAKHKIVITSDALYLQKSQSSMESGIVGRHWDQSYLSTIAKERS